MSLIKVTGECRTGVAGEGLIDDASARHQAINIHDNIPHYFPLLNCVMLTLKY